MPSKFKNLLADLNINEKFNKRVNKDRTFNSVKDGTVLIENYNMMCDLLFLPTARFGFKYCFVIVDLATDKFDIEAIKNKEPDTVLRAMLKCFKRDYVKQPEISIQTDGGREFKGVFHKWLYEHDILQKTTMAYRHQQMSNVEALNKQLARLFNGYMNHKEEITKKVYKNWVEIIPEVREKLNEIRNKDLPIDPYKYKYPPFNPKIIKKKINNKIIEIEQPAKFKEGDMVYYKLEYPRNALNKKQPTAKFRVGDYTYNRDPKEIIIIQYMHGPPYYRYVLDGLPNVSYTEHELMKA
jgi:hypothetical protein